jgi:hypothetical protein
MCPPRLEGAPKVRPYGVEGFFFSERNLPENLSGQITIPVTPALRRRSLLISSGDLSGPSLMQPSPLASPILNDYDIF